MSAAAPVAPHSFLQGANTFFDLPLGGKRNFAYLARLSPGVVPAE